MLERLTGMVEAIGPITVRTGRSQVAFWRRRGFAYLWPPVFGSRGVEIVLSVALDHHVESPRWKQVAHPAPHTWMHHLEVRDLAELDPEVATWLREAFEGAG